MRALLVARKYLLEMIREPKLLGLILGLPAVFLLVNYIGYSSLDRLPTHTLLVWATDPAAEPWITLIDQSRYNDGRRTFQVERIADLAGADEALKSGDASALVIFTPRADGRMGIMTRGDAVSLRFIAASTLLDRLLGQAQNRIDGMPEILQIREQPLAAASPRNEFDAYAPGIMIFAILLLIPQTAMLVGREIRQGTLKRLAVTSLSSRDYLVGVSLAQMIVAAVQVGVIFAAAQLLGFQNRGSLGLALLIGWVLSFSAIGAGLMVACFIQDDTAALNLGSTVTMLGVFLSGAFFAFPTQGIVTLAGHEMGLFDLLPATHGMLILQQVLTGGASFTQVSLRLAIMLALSLVYFSAGIALFAYRQRWQA